MIGIDRSIAAFFAGEKRSIVDGNGEKKERWDLHNRIRRSLTIFFIELAAMIQFAAITMTCATQTAQTKQ